MKTCDYCTHVEMCGWRKEVKEQGCEFFSDGICWIPVSERLPDTDVSVLVSDGVYVWIDELQEDYENGQTMYWWDSQNYFEFDKSAWMPLPKPYREDGE